VTRYCFTSRVDTRQLDRYRERHAAVWPEMLVALRDAGWHNYSLFLAETGLLIGYFEADDKDLAQARMAATDVNARWQAQMAELFSVDGEAAGSPDEAFTYVAEVFHLEDQLRAAGLPPHPLTPGPVTRMPPENPHDPPHPAIVEELAMPPRIVTIGETMALLGTPDHCLLRPGAGPSLTVGGAESNVAIAAARLGVATTWIGRLGDDDLGLLVERELRGQGVDVVARRDPEAPTGLMVKEHRQSRPTRVRYYRRGNAGSRLSPDDVDPAVLAGADVVHLTGITAALSDTARAALRHAVELARHEEATISFDVNYRATLWRSDIAAPVLRDLASAADMVFAGPEEAALLLTGTPDAGPPADPWAAAEQLARQVAELGPRVVVIKLGALGALALADGTVETRPIVPIDPVDPVGAGDAFVGAFLAEFASARPIPACLAAGARMGALVCAVPGDWEGTLDWSAADERPADVHR